MNNTRRAYIYLTCLASLEAVTWAVISLLRTLLAGGNDRSPEESALQIAIVIVGLPFFLLHWLWAQRLAGRDREERGALLRRLYLYGALTAFLSPFSANAFDLLDNLLRAAFGLRLEGYRYLDPALGTAFAHHLAASAVLAVLWSYHARVAAADRQAVGEQGAAGTARRLYLYGFGAAGLLMTSLAVVYLARWLLFQIDGGAVITRHTNLTRELARLAVGLPLWLVFWRWAQCQFGGAGDGERDSVLRKIYLYLAVFAGALATVTTLTLVLADGLGRLLGASSSGSGDLREALSIVMVASLVWAYHAAILRRDAALAGEPATTAWVGRLYRYLVATIGLSVLLVGLGGAVSLLIRTLSGERFVVGFAEETARFSAMALAGLPVWIVPWRQLQAAAHTPGLDGSQERRSVIRKLYLYLFLFLATMTVLGSGIYLVARLVDLILGSRQKGGMWADWGQALAFFLMAVGVWLYHRSILQADGHRVGEEQATRLASLRVAVVDAGDGHLGRTLLEELRRELPGLTFLPLGLTPEAAVALGADVAADPLAVISQADLIIGPWTVAVAGGAAGVVSAELAQAVAASTAGKVLIPSSEAGWLWAGVREPKTRDAVRHAVRAVKQVTSTHDLP